MERFFNLRKLPFSIHTLEGTLLIELLSSSVLAPLHTCLMDWLASSDFDSKLHLHSRIQLHHVVQDFPDCFQHSSIFYFRRTIKV